MIRRCYSNEYKEKAPTYENCTSCREWLNFQVFAKWYHLNRLSDDVKYQLDKDIINRGNKVYSPENCALVPRHINNIILDNKLKRGELPIGVFSSDFPARRVLSERPTDLGLRRIECEPPMFVSPLCAFARAISRRAHCWSRSSRSVRPTLTASAFSGDMPSNRIADSFFSLSNRGTLTMDANGPTPGIVPLPR